MDMEAFYDVLESLESELGGTLGVVASPLRTKELVVEYRHHEVFPAASTIKTFFLQALLEKISSGRLSLNDEVELCADEQVTGSGVLKALTPGQTYPVRDLAMLMIIVSDNTAANQILDLVGVDAVNISCSRNGWSDTHVAGKLQKGFTYASETSPRDLHDYFSRLWRGDLLSESLTNLAKDIYRRQQLTSQLGDAIGYDAYSRETGKSDLLIASKSGSVRGVRNEGGVIERLGSDDLSKSYALAIMTKNCPDIRYHGDNLGSRIVGEVSKALFDLFSAMEVAR